MPTGWKPAHEVLDKTTAVPTIFPGFNVATRVGGLPVRRIHTVHGPTHGGKSAFVLGLLRSFIDAGHPGAYIDAEHATPKDFVNELFERDIDTIPHLMADRPRSYEETITKVDSFLAWVGRQRVGNPTAKDPKDRRPARPDLCSIIIVDSINKLTPRRELDKILTASGEIKNAGKKGESGADELTKGHHARYRAALNQAWLDHLVPLLADANCALVLIAQERDGDEDAFNMEDMVHIKGGAALLFDASCIVRVMKGFPVRKTESDKESPVIGFGHRLRLWKNKVGHMNGRWTNADFHLSNGVLIRPGFDTARDAVKVGEELGVIQRNEGSSWYTWGKKKWQGINAASTSLTKDPASLAALLAAINAKIAA